MKKKDSGKSLAVAFLSNNPIQAEEVRCLLEGNGLLAFVWDSHVVTLNPVYGGPLGGVKVMVPEDQLEAARDVLRDAGRLPSGDSPLPARGDSFHPYTDVFKSRPAPDGKPARAKGAGEQAPLDCPDCGAKNEPDSVYCDQCSRRLGA